MLPLLLRNLRVISCGGAHVQAREHGKKDNFRRTIDVHDIAELVYSDWLVLDTVDHTN